ncbi:hypothetical protein E3N88_25849 [Mikania micrantha]|uniref:Cytochrome P450 n=1 Tax=Mikania micrantha TaxID=192012 RepID=A0A5N6N7H3_9ASTR|nr:hypothetical protein E3N88_25849 [Mikania micrantha]
MTQQNIHASGLSDVGNNNALTLLLVTISSLILAILWYKFKPSNSSSNGAPPLPPGPRSLPIVGYIPFLSSSLHTQFVSIAQTYGPIFKLKLGSKLYIVISNPELSKEVVRDQDDIFSNRDQSVAGLTLTYDGQDIVISNNNPNWRKLRKIFVHEIQSHKNLEATISFRRDEVRNCVKTIFGKIGTATNVREIVFSTETNILIRTIWETSLDKGGLKDQNLGAKIDMVATNIVKIFARPNLSDFFPFLARFDLQHVERDMQMQHDKMDELFTTIIEDRIQYNLKKSKDEGKNDGKKDFIEILLEYKDEKDGKPLSTTQMKALLMDLMIAGTETTATTVEWAMTHIIGDRNIMNKIQEELAEVVGLENKVEESHAPKLKYLEATIKETLRMYPIVPFLIPRSPSKTCTVGGYTIPKGCTIILNVWSIQRDPHYWENPLEFRPERFLNTSWDFKGTNLVYFPFGSGRRICAGLPMAEKMLMYILASLLHSFDWRLAKPEEHNIKEVFGIAIKKKTPLICIPSQRLSDKSLYM